MANNDKPFDYNSTYQTSRKTFNPDTVYSRYNFGNAADEISYSNSKYGEKFKDFLDSLGYGEGSPAVTREEFLRAAEDKGWEKRAEAELFLAVAEGRWASFTLGQSSTFLEGVQEVYNVVNQNYKPALEATKGLLEANKQYLDLLQNPTFALIQQFLDSIRLLLNDFKETGLYWYGTTSEDVGEDVQIKIPIDNAYNSFLRNLSMGSEKDSNWIQNRKTGRLMYIDYQIATDENGNRIFDTNGVPVPRRNDAGESISTSESIQLFKKYWEKPSFKQATIESFINQFQKDLKVYSADIGGRICRYPSNTPDFSNDANVGAVVLYAGAPDIRQFFTTLVKIVNTFQSVLFAPLNGILRAFIPFIDAYRQHKFITPPHDNKAYIFTITYVRNPDGLSTLKNKKFRPGKKPILKWSDVLKNPEGADYGYVKLDEAWRIEQDEVTDFDYETVSLEFMYLNNKKQSKQDPPERTFIRHEASGRIFEICYVLKEEYIEPATSTQSELTDSAIKENETPFYNQKIVVVEVDPGQNKGEITSDSIVYDVMPHDKILAIGETLNETEGSAELDEIGLVGYRWKIKNGERYFNEISLGETQLTVEDVVLYNIKWAQLQYLISTIINRDAVNTSQNEQLNLVKQRYQELMDLIAKEGLEIWLPKREVQGEETLGTNKYEKIVIMNRGAGGAGYQIDSSQKIYYDIQEKIYIIDELNNLLTSDITGYPADERKKFIKSISKYQTYTAEESLVSLANESNKLYSPIEQSFIEYVFLSTGKTPDPKTDSVRYGLLKSRENWTWIKNVSELPGPVYGKLQSYEECKFPTMEEFKKACFTLDGNGKDQPWGRVAIEDFLPMDGILENIDGFLNTLEDLIEPFNTLLTDLITEIENTIKKIDDLISALDSFVNFLLSLGDLGLYILIIENDFGGTERIVQQLRTLSLIHI